MKRVRVILEAVVEDEQIKEKSDLFSDGYDGYEDAIISEGLDGIIDGSFEYNVTYDISDV